MKKLKVGEWAWSRSMNRPFKVAQVLSESYVEELKDGSKYYHSIVNTDKYEEWSWAK